MLAARPRKKAGTTLWSGLKYLDSLEQLRVQVGRKGCRQGARGLLGTDRRGAVDLLQLRRSAELV